MKRKISYANMMKQLHNEKVETWFDLGLFLDRLKDSRNNPSTEFQGSFEDFQKGIQQGGIGFVTFYFTVDGVTIEVEKYAKILRRHWPEANIHYIAGEFFPEADKLIPAEYKRYAIPEARGFDNWELYNHFFKTKLQRGSKEYNALITKFWKEALIIAEKLAKYIEDNDISLLYLINVCSNPGNVSLALASVIVSEYLGIPVINNSHDYYWEGGNRKVDIKNKKLKEGPRDFFFTNADVGEFFSVIEVLYPWQSDSWFTLNINRQQSTHIIKENGHNPANVAEIGTAVDLGEFSSITKRMRINAFKMIRDILSRYNDQLVAYNCKDVIEGNLVHKENPAPILIKLGGKTGPLPHFEDENIIFLQPTRIIARKRIGVGFNLLKKMLNKPETIYRFKESPTLKLTFLISGPIPLGQYEYFQQVVSWFYELQKEIDTAFHNRIFLAFTFSEMDKEHFKLRYKNPLTIPLMYSIASLVMLPSKTEGRGLPIIEAAACGVPIFCRRYYPENVYSDVIGEHLPESKRLKVIEYNGQGITNDHVQSIVERVFYPHKFMDEIVQNLNAVQERYSLDSLSQEFIRIAKKLFLQMQNKTQEKTLSLEQLKNYKTILEFSNEDLQSLVNTQNRQYMAGYGKLAFMSQLKSLIDPSFFRVEEMGLRGRVFDFSLELLGHNTKHTTMEQRHCFFNTVESIFSHTDGDVPIHHDHSFSYRHRFRKHFLYQDMSFQELTGLVNLIYLDMFKPTNKRKIVLASHFFTDWNLAISQLTSSTYLAIDHREKLFEKLKANVPIAYFPGKFLKYELEFFALQSVRARLKLPLEEELTESHLEDTPTGIAPIYLFAQKFRVGRWLTKEDIEDYLENHADNELKLLYKYKILRIVESHQLCIGIHFTQIGERGLKILRQIRDQQGFIICVRRNSAIMTDIVDIDRFHIGKASDELIANFLGIELNSGYIQYVPAGLRPTLAYPTPVQTAKQFSETLKGDKFKSLCTHYNETFVLCKLKKDAEEFGNPIDTVLDKLLEETQGESAVNSSFVSGLYPDGHPWNGAMAKVNVKDNSNWNFVIVSSTNKTKKVTAFVDEFEQKSNYKGKVAWNGGYILNPELVGKLGLPESYIGSPLGLLISNGEVLCPPLFNKPALLIHKDGKIDIKRVNCKNGLAIEAENKMLEFGKENYNPSEDYTGLAIYDLNNDIQEIQCHERTLVRIAGNVIKEISTTKNDEKRKIIPVGLTLAIPKNQMPKNWKVATQLILTLPGLEDIAHAVEAGPMLINNGEIAIDMETEGWKLQHSIRTQAARLDYTDMRGPKIAAGIDKEGNLHILTVNGRIRESVGATHIDMAEILHKYGMQQAMGFDPGGSSTLVVDGKTLNISPYNKQYEQNIYSLPPEPRAVANAIIGYLE
jgi:glycosyltransferase involved in cell wall biosynthesis